MRPRRSRGPTSAPNPSRENDDRLRYLRRRDPTAGAGLLHRVRPPPGARPC